MTPERAKYFVEKAKKTNWMHNIICAIASFYIVLFSIFEWIPAIVK